MIATFVNWNKILSIFRENRYFYRYGEAAWYYIQAEQWTQAHEIIIEHLAADAIINGINFSFLFFIQNFQKVSRIGKIFQNIK